MDSDASDYVVGLFTAPMESESISSILAIRYLTLVVPSSSPVDKLDLSGPLIFCPLITYQRCPHQVHVNAPRTESLGNSSPISVQSLTPDPTESSMIFPLHFIKVYVLLAILILFIIQLVIIVYLLRIIPLSLLFLPSQFLSLYRKLFLTQVGDRL